MDLYLWMLHVDVPFSHSLLDRLRAKATEDVRTNMGATIRHRGALYSVDALCRCSFSHWLLDHLLVRGTENVRTTMGATIRHRGMYTDGTVSANTQ